MSVYLCGMAIAALSASARFARWTASHPQAAHFLTRHLQATVAQLEDFVTILHDNHAASGGASGQPGSAALRMLSRPFRLRLQRERDEESLRTFPPSVVLIEPLATGRAIEDFLWNKVRTDLPEGGMHPLAMHLEAMRRRREAREDDEVPPPTPSLVGGIHPERLLTIIDGGGRLSSRGARR